MGRVDLQNESLVELIRDHEWGTFSPFLLSHSVKSAAQAAAQRDREPGAGGRLKTEG